MSEAALSFPGFVLPAQVPSWGGMLSREGRQYMEMAPKLGALAWTLPHAGRLLLQHVWRCGAGSVRSPPARGPGQSRHHKEETQTMLALQIAQPLCLQEVPYVCSSDPNWCHRDRFTDHGDGSNHSRVDVTVVEQCVIPPVSFHLASGFEPGSFGHRSSTRSGSVRS